MTARYRFTEIEIEASSSHDFAEATNAAIAEAAKLVPALRWFEVKALGGKITDGKRSEFRIRFTVGS